MVDKGGKNCTESLGTSLWEQPRLGREREVERWALARRNRHNDLLKGKTDSEEKTNLYLLNTKRPSGKKRTDLLNFFRPD